VHAGNANLHNRRRTQWKTEQHLATAPTSILEILEVAVTAMIITPVAGSTAAAAAAAINKTPAQVAVGPTPMEMSNSGTKLGALSLIRRALEASR